MASVQDLSDKIAAIKTNLDEQAAEVGRIGTVLADIRTQLATGASPEQLTFIDEQLGALIVDSQTVEDSLRTTT